MRNSKILIRRKVSSCLKNKLKEFGVTRVQVAKDLGITYTTMCDYVKGRTLPAPEDMIRIAEYFKTVPSEIYGWKDDQFVDYGFIVNRIDKAIKSDKNKIKINDEEYIKMEIIERILRNE